MVTARDRGADQREASRALPLASRTYNAWRLLVRIATVRWVAIILGASYALVARPLHASPALLIAGIIIAAAINGSVALHGRFPQLQPGTMVAITLTGDFLWITLAAVAILANQADVTAVVGYVVLASECGLLLGGRGAVVSVALAIAGLISVEVLRAQHMLGPPDLSRLTYEGGAVAVSAVFVAVASAGLRAQYEQLTEQATALARHARTDHLTGLGNLLAMREAADALHATPYGLLMIDVDGLRSANVVYGHQAGDEMLVSVARALTSVRAADEIAVRLAEDKFVVLLPSAGEARTCHSAEEVRVAAYGMPVSVGQLRVSVGCAWTSGGETLDAVIARADDALFAAKALGGDRVVAQGAGSGEGRWRWRSAVESVLSSERGVYAVYQAIIRLHPYGSIAGWEALSRPRDWPPSASVEGLFLTAHRLGRGRELDWRCRRTALLQSSRLAGDLFVNVSVAALAHPMHHADQMLLLCQWASRDPRSVVLELSERDAVPDLRRLCDALREHRDAGFRFAIDDVGHGQTTLELLVAAQPEFIKLAQPLIQAAQPDRVARSAIHALVAFAHDIGAQVVAEGVEDERDLDLCKEMGIDLGQGWLLGRPMPTEPVPGTG